MTNETAVQPLKGYQDLACDNRSVSREHVRCMRPVIGRTSRESNEATGLLQKG
jgi:hypothetical protein